MDNEKMKRWTWQVGSKKTLKNQTLAAWYQTGRLWQNNNKTGDKARCCMLMKGRTDQEGVPTSTHALASDVGICKAIY